MLIDSLTEPNISRTSDVSFVMLLLLKEQTPGLQLSLGMALCHLPEEIEWLIRSRKSSPMPYILYSSRTILSTH